MIFSELVDIGELRQLCESFTAMTGAVTAILDLEGNVLVATGWQEICTSFHRVHPETVDRCRESDTVLAGKLAKGESYNLYQCRNGLVDVAVPITIAGEHVANLFTGQFFLEPPNRGYFARQAEEFGFDTPTYLEALDRVPIYSENHVRMMMEFLSRLARLIGEIGLARKQAEEANAELRRHAQALIHEETLHFIAQRGWFDHSGDFLTALATHLGTALAVDYVVIDRIVTDEPGVVETVALYAKGTSLPSLRYSLENTPCENVMGKTLCYYPSGVQALFPSDCLLTEMEVESYAGVPLWDSEGEALGLIAVMDGKPFSEGTTLKNILQLVATSASAALERERNDAILRESEERYRMVFENSPVSIWEEDFSGVKELFVELRRQGVSDIEAHLDSNPGVVERCAEQARIINVNGAALKLHGAASKDELLAGLVNTFTPDSYATFREELICLWNGGTAMIRDAGVKTLNGEPRQVTVYFAVCPGYEDTFGRVIVSLVDITERKRVEEAIHLQTLELEEEVAERQMAQESLQEKALLLEEEIEKRQIAQDGLEQLNSELEQRVKERTTALEEKYAELERMNKIFIGRELRMVELKERIRELEEKTATCLDR